MTKGTTSRGKRQKTVHIICRRCGKRAYHMQKKVCASCGYGKTTKIRGFNWAKEH